MASRPKNPARISRVLRLDSRFGSWMATRSPTRRTPSKAPANRPRDGAAAPAPVDPPGTSRRRRWARMPASRSNTKPAPPTPSGISTMANRLSRVCRSMPQILMSIIRRMTRLPISIQVPRPTSPICTTRSWMTPP